MCLSSGGTSLVVCATIYRMSREMNVYLMVEAEQTMWEGAALEGRSIACVVV